MNSEHIPYAWTREHLCDVLCNSKAPVVSNVRIADAFSKIDRKDFVPETQKALAYNDIDIDLGFGEKLPKPTIIAQQLELLNPRPGKRYLEIGAGSGYTSALAGMCLEGKGEVIGLERILLLVEKANRTIAQYPDIASLVQIVFKDGSKGLVEKAPFDGILISASFEKIPEEIKKQLKIGGRLVVPTLDLNMRVIDRKSIDLFVEQIHPGFVFDPIKSGVH